MRPRPKIYLAGPEVFLAEAAAIGRRKTELCAQFGFEGLFPLETAMADGRAAADRPDRRIFRENMRMIRAADCGIVNLTPFRGPSADVGTVFELGVLAGSGKPCFAYSNDSAPLLARMRRDGAATFDAQRGRWIDPSGMTIEDFGNVDNLMLDACLAEQSRPIVRRQSAPERRFTDLDGFVVCLALARRHLVSGDAAIVAPRA